MAIHKAMPAVDTVNAEEWDYMGIDVLRPPYPQGPV